MYVSSNRLYISAESGTGLGADHCKFDQAETALAVPEWMFSIAIWKQ